MFLWVDKNVGILFLESVVEKIKGVFGFIREKPKPKPKHDLRKDDDEILEIIISFVLSEG